jgi:hypothetical protein
MSSTLSGRNPNSRWILPENLTVTVVYHLYACNPRSVPVSRSKVKWADIDGRCSNCSRRLC